MWAYIIAGINQPLNGICDLKLSTLRRLDVLCGLENMMIETIDSNQSQVAGRNRWLLDETKHTWFQAMRRDIIKLQLCYTKFARLLDVCEDNTAVILAIGKRTHNRFKWLTDQVIAKHHNETISSQKLA